MLAAVKPLACVEARATGFSVWDNNRPKEWVLDVRIDLVLVPVDVNLDLYISVCVNVDKG